MNIGLLTDLHLGHTGEGRWHNRLLFDHAEHITRSAIALLNQQALDIVFVLGDMTQNGQPTQLTLAREVLADLTAPWFVLPGNHDSALVRTGQFDSAFAGRLVQPYMRLGDVGIASLREHTSGGPYQEPLYQIDTGWAQQAVQGIRAGCGADCGSDCPRTLLVLSHFPLLDEQLWADHNNGKDAGRFLHGETQLARLRAAIRPDCAAHDRRVLLFCGHEHWHHITQGHDWVQCVTASLIEYPLEVRVVTLDEDALNISTLSTPVEAMARQSIDALDAPALWVRGRAQDREYGLQSLTKGV